MSKKGNAVRNVAIGAAIAGAVGYVAGLLTSPHSGKENRKIVKDKASQTWHDAEKKLKSLHSELDKLIAQGKSATKNASEKVKTDWEKALAVALVARDKVRTVLSALHEGDADDKDLEKAMKQAEEAVLNLKNFLAKDLPKANAKK